MPIIEERENRAKQFAIEISKRWQIAYRWPETHFFIEDSLVVCVRNRLFATFILPGKSKEFAYVRLNSSDQSYLDRRMFAEVVEGEEYLILCDAGDLWQFRCIPSPDHSGISAAITIITMAPSDRVDNALDALQYRFPFVIPWKQALHLLIKAGKDYTVFLITPGFEEIDNWSLPQYITDTLILPANASREITQHTSIPLTIRTLPADKHPESGLFPYTDVSLIEFGFPTDSDDESDN